MKNKLLLLFFLCLFSLGIVHANTLPLLGKVIYIDPGHGGKDPGAISNGINESDINLEIGFKLQEILEKNGAIVYMSLCSRQKISRRLIFNRISPSGDAVFFSSR